MCKIEVNQYQFICYKFHDRHKLYPRSSNKIRILNTNRINTDYDLNTGGCNFSTPMGFRSYQGAIFICEGKIWQILLFCLVLLGLKMIWYFSSVHKVLIPEIGEKVWALPMNFQLI